MQSKYTVYRTWHISLLFNTCSTSYNKEMLEPCNTVMLQSCNRDCSILHTSYSKQYQFYCKLSIHLHSISLCNNVILSLNNYCNYALRVKFSSISRMLCVLWYYEGDNATNIHAYGICIYLLLHVLLRVCSVFVQLD